MKYIDTKDWDNKGKYDYIDDKEYRVEIYMRYKYAKLYFAPEDKYDKVTVKVYPLYLTKEIYSSYSK